MCVVVVSILVAELIGGINRWRAYRTKGFDTASCGQLISIKKVESLVAHESIP